MPYISKDRRPAFQRDINSLVAEIKTEGELTFVLYSICVALFRAHPRYATINHITGSLTNTLQELYRQHFGEYERSAIERNGDV